jgi:hypothetical protein
MAPNWQVRIGEVESTGSQYVFGVCPVFNISGNTPPKIGLADVVPFVYVSGHKPHPALFAFATNTVLTLGFNCPAVALANAFGFASVTPPVPAAIVCAVWFRMPHWTHCVPSQIFNVFPVGAPLVTVNGENNCNGLGVTVGHIVPKFWPDGT